MRDAEAVFTEALQKEKQTAVMLFYRYGIAGYPKQQPGWIATFFNVTATEVKERTDRLVAEILGLLYQRVAGFEIPRAPEKERGTGKVKRKKTVRSGKLSLVKTKVAKRPGKRR